MQLIRFLAVLGGTLLLASLPTAAADVAANGNSLSSPISTTLVRYAIETATQRDRESSAIAVPRELLSECTDGELNTPGPPVGNRPEATPDRVFINDMHVVANATTIQHFGRSRSLGTNCRLSFTQANTTSIHVNAIATFRDEYFRGGSSSSTSRPMDFRTGSGLKLRVPASILRATGGVASFKDMKVAAVSFRDQRYALFVVLGRGLTLNKARGYFQSADFRRRAGYHGNVTIWLPHVRLSSARRWCVESCGTALVTQHVSLGLSDSGAGDAPGLPKYLPENGVPYSIYEPFALTGGSPIVLKADEPFYVAIVAVRTQVVLFDAFVERPTP